MKLTDVYDKKTLVWLLIGLAVLCLAMKVSNGAVFAVIFFPMLIAFTKNKPGVLLYCLLATALLTMTNPFLAPKGTAFSFEARFVYLLAGGVLFFQLVGQRKSPFVMPLASILFYIAYMAIVSAAGWQPLISYLKLVLFLIVFFANDRIDSFA